MSDLALNERISNDKISKDNILIDHAPTRRSDLNVALSFDVRSQLVQGSQEHYFSLFCFETLVIIHLISKTLKNRFLHILTHPNMHT